MKDTTNHAVPDFQVDWQDSLAADSESIWLDALKYHTGGMPSRLRNATATLHTGSIFIEVSDLDWTQPTSLTLTPFRVGLSSVISASTSIRYGYDRGSFVPFSGAGHIAFLIPGKPIYADIAPGRLSTVTCSFDQEFAESILGPIEQLSPEITRDALRLRNPLISTLLLRLMREAIYAGPISHMVAQTFGQAILVECAHWHRSISEAAQPKALITAQHFAVIERHLSVLTEKPPNVAELAAACGFSERYFAKIFRAQTGITISQYTKSLRISQAKALLLDTQLSLKEIAFRLGFSSPANFSSAFSAATGQTPGQFRNGE